MCLVNWAWVKAYIISAISHLLVYVVVAQNFVHWQRVSDPAETKKKASWGLVPFRRTPGMFWWM